MLELLPLPGQWQEPKLCQSCHLGWKDREDSKFRRERSENPRDWSKGGRCSAGESESRLDISDFPLCAMCECIYRSFETTVSHLNMCDFFQERLLKVLKCYNFYECNDDTTALQRRAFANCVMTPYLLEVHLQTFLSIPITQKYQIFSCDTLVANGLYIII